MAMDINGKEYESVVERLNKMKKDVDGKYDLTTEILEYTNGRYIVKATLKLSNSIYTGHACQLNKIAALEKCETFAIGRALASAGYAGREFCSAEELIEALKDLNLNPQKATEKQVALIKSKINAINATEEQQKKWLEQTGVTKWEDCPIEKVSKVIDFLNKLQK